jgi:hypothetical protein
MDITFDSFVTPEGMLVAGALISGLVEVLKAVFPALNERVSGAIQAFSLSAILYGITAFVLAPSDPNAYLGIFAAWLGVAATAVGVRETLVHANDVRTGRADTP